MSEQQKSSIDKLVELVKNEEEQEDFSFSNEFSIELQNGISTAMHEIADQFGFEDTKSAGFAKQIAREVEYMVTAKLLMSELSGEGVGISPICVMKMMMNRHAERTMLMIAINAFLYGVHFAKTEMK